MGNSASTPPPPIDNEKLSQSGIIIISVFFGLATVFGIIFAIFKFSENYAVIKHGVSGALSSVSSTKTGGVTHLPWDKIIPGFLGLMCIYYFSIAFWYKYTKGQYRATPESSVQVKAIQEAKISSASLSLTNGNSVCAALTRSPIAVPFTLITTNANSRIGDSRSLVNWRPLTVRLPGYINSPTGSTDGVFSPNFAIDNALTLGSRGFFFDIDYEDAKPCAPIIMYRDDSGIKRSLNNGDITLAMTELAAKAFTTNYDPVLIILYLRRVPAGINQQSNFFGSIASYLNPLSDFHLGQTDKGNFHSCRSESILFTSPITDFQKKFIVITNYNTSRLPSRSNPKDNLHFWTNARIYKYPGDKTAGLSSVTPDPDPAITPQCLIGHATQFLNVDTSSGSDQLSAAHQQTSGKFCIAIASPDYPYSPAQVSKLMNVLGIQCVPLDVIGLGITATHAATKNYAINPQTNFASLTSLDPLYNMNPYDSASSTTRSTDILSFWTYTGWSMKKINSGTQGFQDYKEGFEEAAPIPVATSIPGFIIPKPTPPKQPSPKMNSNGGLVTIS